MSDKTNVLKPPPTIAGRGGRGFDRGGSRGTQGDDGDPDDPTPEDFERLAKMLSRIRTTLRNLISDDYGVLNHELRAEFVRTWPRADNNLANTIRRLHQEADPRRILPTHGRLRRQLQRVGMTGDMLRMKERSLNFYLNPLDFIISQPLTDKASLGERAIGKLLTWTKPAFKVMNSILGSLLKAFPGMEIVKELKEHVEAGYEIAEAKQEVRE